MKLHVLSDLHNEFSPYQPTANAFDLVILGGDIDVKGRGVTWANEAFQCPVIYICGNHEYYGGHIDHTLRKMKEAALPHVHVLENETFIWNQTRFLCATAWTDFSATGNVVAAAQNALERMNDFSVIRIDDSFRKLRPCDLFNRNHATHDWLAHELDKPFDGKTVVVTHHAPVREVVGDKYEGHLIAAYTNSWHALLEKADLWIFGHTHRAIDVKLGRCRVVSNPRGYPREDTSFDPSLVVSLS
ncbi:metallophosphoesterase [Pseudomonas vancouverensis]|uniref:Serine/threonine protein phosphatase n=1 Tax=Pseudomonas vancouverensis TaxID=95300 RepID=A0A1H2MDK0_PSEVA|nr:metallophosphoesterase [Pseudomonas vancouverensis]KAB0499101.1 serine/threonine protein phosphatase [Pseudomonas vancouverensis]TDB57797.1 serine/threonine protein phosphatase [Pseudomonas vancouverensis]SDU91018.1 Calcineurin-like phosphoesterase [Pseudomonas vancouverensis]